MRQSKAKMSRVLVIKNKTDHEKKDKDNRHDSKIFLIADIAMIILSFLKKTERSIVSHLNKCFSIAYFNIETQCILEKIEHVCICARVFETAELLENHVTEMVKGRKKGQMLKQSHQPYTRKNLKQIVCTVIGYNGKQCGDRFFEIEVENKRRNHINHCKDKHMIRGSFGSPSQRQRGKNKEKSLFECKRTLKNFSITEKRMKEFDYLSDIETRDSLGEQ